MEQNSEDAMGTKRSAEIHSGEVKRAELAQREPPGKRSCFAEYRLLRITNLTYRETFNVIYRHHVMI
ncbi:hypothetical protein BB776_05475 [Planococcus salinarum]|uniref:Uncharacterized protein n=1 Tax=Planococcus salinarum TaxID=622695 RepID=A0ABX3D1H7_9BACL|nr:hypothetical protein BB776_05475 [Planococcus salinarum]